MYPGQVLSLFSGYLFNWSRIFRRVLGRHIFNPRDTRERGPALFSPTPNPHWLECMDLEF